MQRLQNEKELSYLSEIMQIYTTHARVQFFHEQGYPSAYVRFRNYLSRMGECAQGLLPLNQFMDEMQIHESEIEQIMQELTISKMQACLIYTINDALEWNTEIEKSVTQDDFHKFLTDLSSFTRNIEKYLPEKTVSKLHNILFKNIATISSDESLATNSRFFKEKVREDKETTNIPKIQQ